MNTSIKNILQNNDFSKDDIIELLYANQSETKFLYQKAKEVKSGQIGDKVYLRGLIEFSNLCAKDCFYCGIRKSNKNVQRYSLSDREIIQAAKFAFDEHYGSIVLQSGEVKSREFENRVDRLLKQIRKITGNNFGITLSCGEQKESTYSRWFESGANRYLLRIETSNKELYKQIHPNNSLHSFQKRIDSLRVLKNIGYQVGTGVMVGLPGQTLSHIADDILFMKDIDIDMCGVGPYIEHHETPLFEQRTTLMPLNARFELTLKVLAILRIIMKDINIAASTALQSIDKLGREKAIQVAANVFMPNITPQSYRKNYNLYDNKPCIAESPVECKSCTAARITLANGKVAFGEAGDAKHYLHRMNRRNEILI
ncbi:MAG: [FeFe] hydrogenase H-cluster radical SAM maturase HydE [Bacteroidales bacterium]|jgi:biotin synthase